MLESDKAENFVSLPDVSEVEMFTANGFSAIIIGFVTSIIVVDSSVFKITLSTFISVTGIETVFFGISAIE